MGSKYLSIAALFVYKLCLLIGNFFLWSCSVAARLPFAEVGLRSACPGWGEEGFALALVAERLAAHIEASLCPHGRHVGARLRSVLRLYSEEDLPCGVELSG